MIITAHMQINIPKISPQSIRSLLMKNAKIVTQNGHVCMRMMLMYIGMNGIAKLQRRKAALPKTPRNMRLHFRLLLSGSSLIGFNPAHANSIQATIVKIVPRKSQ